MGILDVFGKPGKAGKQQSNTKLPGGQPDGPESGDNTMQAAAFRFGRQPIAWQQAMRLFNATSLVSPMVAGRFRPQDVSNPARRSPPGGFGTPDLGALQGFRGSFAGPRTVRLGAQSGPSQQPGFPSTNNDSSVDLSGLGLPDVWRVNRL